MSAFMSDEAYKSPSERSRSIMGYEIMEGYNHPEYVAYKNDTVKHIVLAFRGTARKKDILTDIALASGFGEKTGRFKESLRVYDELSDKYKEYNITTTGHSLAGFLSTRVNRKRGKLSVAFNEGVGIDGVKDDRLAIHHRTSKDVVSLLGKGKADETIQRDKLFGSHTIGNFVPYNALL